MAKHDDHAQREDERWMRRALDLAHRSVGLASPNPAVGCVLVKDGHLVGEGFHVYDERDHAEVVALRAAGSNAKDATAYVTLEPCSHTGRTGPCSEALAKGGIRRAVIATADPNPVVNGCGMDRLRQAGISVEVGLLREEARELNDGFARHIQTRLPFVTLKAGVSLDGRIAPAPGKRAERAPVMLTGAESQAEVQRMRRAADAIITGINTVLADDPLLTDRTGLPRRRPLLRVVLDSNLRLPVDSKLAKAAKDDVLVFCVDADAGRREALERCGVRVERLEADTSSGGVLLSRALERLGEVDVTSAMLEGGARLNASAMQGCVDKVSLFYAPVLLGDDAVPLISGGGRIELLALRTRTTKFGPDVLLEAYLRDPWVAVKD